VIEENKTKSASSEEEKKEWSCCIIKIYISYIFILIINGINQAQNSCFKSGT
jgi:hypothetical protein